MKKKELQQLKTKPSAELKTVLAENRDKLWNLQNDMNNGKVKNVKSVQQAKKAIAQIMTLINQKND